MYHLNRLIVNIGLALFLDFVKEIFSELLPWLGVLASGKGVCLVIDESHKSESVYIAFGKSERNNNGV